MSLSVPIRSELYWRAGDHPGDLQVRLAGELCIWTLSCIEPALWGLVSVRRPAIVTLDLSGVTFIDARAVSLLSRLAQHVASWDGEVAVLRPSWVVARLLTLVGVDGELQLAWPIASLRGCEGDAAMAGREHASVGFR